MRKIIGILLISAILSLSLVSAHMGGGLRSGHMGHHEEMEKIMEQGTYKDLVAHREEIGWNVKPWVTSEEDFELAKGMHERMEKRHEGNTGFYGMNGMGNGCHMRG